MVTWKTIKYARSSLGVNLRNVVRKNIPNQKPIRILMFNKLQLIKNTTTQNPIEIPKFRYLTNDKNKR